jgi:hypothetical protein
MNRPDLYLFGSRARALAAGAAVAGTLLGCASSALTPERRAEGAESRRFYETSLTPDGQAVHRELPQSAPERASVDGEPTVRASNERPSQPL